MKDQSPPDMLDRLLIASNSKNDAALASRLGISSQSVYNVRKKGQVPPNWVFDIAKTFSVSSDWLFFGSGQMLRDDGADPMFGRRTEAHTGAELLLIPMVDAVLSAGHGSLQTSAESERKYAFRSDFLRRRGNPSEMVLMRVDGNSMEPRICSGDIVLIDQSQKVLRPEQIYAVGVEDMIFLKEVSAVPGKVVLRSLNDAYPPLEVDTRGDLQDSVRIVGRCVWSCREL